MFTPSHGSARARQPPGLTFVETVLALMILGLASLAVIEAVSAGQAHVVHGQRVMRAVSLAESLLSEIQDLPYEDPDGLSALGPDTGETGRSDFDNLDDYHGYVESPGTLTDFSGTLLPDEAQGCSRLVTAAYGTQTVAALGGAVHGITLTVTIAEPQGETWKISRFVPEPAP